jgi:glycerate 2-kinase
MPRIVLAPDKFKGTLTAAEVAQFLAAGIRTRQPDVDLVTVPVADGGDGLLEAFQAAGFGRVPVDAADALGTVRPTYFVRRAEAAVVELAAVTGLAPLADRRAPLTASSRGVGEVLAAAFDAGCRRLVLGVGGSASTDGGVGMVQALGARITDAAGGDVGPGGLGAAAATRVDLSGLHPALREATIEVACDVDNPLTGPHGAATTYGPQKGADADDVRHLDAAMESWADVVAAATGADRRAEPGAGAAGGVGFAAAAILGARLRPGAALVLDLVGLTDALVGADLVVTGEGSLDEQTLHGKAPAGVAAAARAAHVPSVAVAGRCTLPESSWRRAGFDAVYTLVDEAEDPQEAFTDAGRLLRVIGARVADQLAGARA